MSKNGKIKYAVSGFLVGAIFFGGITFAATSKIEVSFDSVKFIVDKVDKTPANNKFNNNGTTVPASLMYSGTTYVPLKLMASMLGKPVEWDGKTKSVLVGNSVVEGDYLSDLTPSRVKGTASINSKMLLDKQEYKKGFSFDFGSTGNYSYSYSLNGQYTSFTFVYGMDDSTSVEKALTVKILGDGKELWKGITAKGIPATDASIDVNGVLELSIEVIEDDSKWHPYPFSLDIINPMVVK